MSLYLRNNFPFFCNNPQWARASSFTRFQDHTQRRTPVGRTPDKWLARPEDLYFTTHNTHNRQTSMLPGGIRIHNLSRRVVADVRLRRSATGIDCLFLGLLELCYRLLPQFIFEFALSRVSWSDHWHPKAGHLFHGIQCLTYCMTFRQEQSLASVTLAHPYEVKTTIINYNIWMLDKIKVLLARLFTEEQWVFSSLVIFIEKITFALSW
jgi:hypothetical protein